MTPEEMHKVHRAAFSQGRPWSIAEFAELLGSPGCFACGDGNCFALGRVMLDEAELLTIATLPSARRQGHARKIMAEWQSQAKSRGATRAFLEVSAENSAAIALYDALGYRSCGLRKNYYRLQNGGRADAVLMQKTL